MRELYIKDGRESKDHPMHGFYTGLKKRMSRFLSTIPTNHGFVGLGNGRSIPNRR